MRNTSALRAVLGVLLESPETPRYGYEITRRTRYQSSTVNTLLDRLADEGYVSQEWEASTSGPGRPLRHYARLTEKGVVFARQKLDEWEKRQQASW